MAEKWRVAGTILGACSCDWGCPCNFDAKPTKGFCEGGYTWVVKEGSYGGTKLDGLVFQWLGHAPGPLHEGNVTSVGIVDEKATPEQRAAAEAFYEGGGLGAPWDIFAAVTAKRLPTIYAPIEVSLNGIKSSVKVDGGRIYEMSLSRIRNPVSGDEEEIYLDKPTGFTSLRCELGMNTVLRLNAGDLSIEQSGQYGEIGEFDYASG